MSLQAADGSTVDADQGYSHVVGKVQARGDGREVGTKTAEEEKKQTWNNFTNCWFNSWVLKPETSV